MRTCVHIRENKQVGTASFKVGDVNSRKDLEKLPLLDSLVAGHPLSSFQAIIDLEKFY